MWHFFLGQRAESCCLWGGMGFVLLGWAEEFLLLGVCKGVNLLQRVDTVVLRELTVAHRLASISFRARTSLPTSGDRFRQAKASRWMCQAIAWSICHPFSVSR